MSAEHLPRRALICVTYFNEPLYPDGKRTGLYFTEALHPFLVLTEAGFDVDLVSETGTVGLDEHSITDEALSNHDMAIFKDPNHPFMVKLTKDLKKASDANPSHYGVFFAAGGHGTLWDYPKDTGLIRLAEDVYRRGGIVAAVCHGPAILPSIKDDSGKPIIRNKTVTGFTDQGEIIVGMDEVLKKAGVTYVNEAVEKAGGKYVEPPGGPLDDFSVADGRIITGTNPASATSTAYKVVEAFCG